MNCARVVKTAFQKMSHIFTFTNNKALFRDSTKKTEKQSLASLLASKGYSEFIRLLETF